MKRIVRTLAMMTFAMVVMMACTLKNEPMTNRIRFVDIVTPTPLISLTVKDYPGRVKESDHINLAFKTGGQIERIGVRVGDRVEKGQFLANIDSSDYVLGLRNYEVQYRQMKGEVERLKTLYEKRSVSENDYEKAVAGLEQLEIAVEGSRRKVAYTSLHAPASGVITDVFYSASELVDAGMAVFSLLADSEMEVFFDIPVAEYLERDNFGKICCVASFAPDISMPMRVLSVTPKADNSQLYRVYLAFNDTVCGHITPGMTVSVKVEKHNRNKCGVSIPISSVCVLEQEPFVWVVDDSGILRKRKVELGSIDKNGCVIVRSGLNETDTIVKTGVSALQEGEYVRVLPRPSETNVGNLL